MSTRNGPPGRGAVKRSRSTRGVSCGAVCGGGLGQRKHDVLVQDAGGEEVLGATFTHDERGLNALCNTLVRLGVVRVAIERPDGLLIERLLDAGLRVIAMHPNQVAAARPRFRASGGKSDRFDAFVLCELARTDHHRFRVLVCDSDDTKALRALSRAREDLVQTRVALANQLRAELERFWPGAGVIFADVDSSIGLAFLARSRAPATPEVWATSASRCSLRVTPTAGASSPRSCSPSSAMPLRDEPAMRRSRRAARSCSPWSPRWRRSSRRSAG
jgi:transposase